MRWTDPGDSSVSARLRELVRNGGDVNGIDPVIDENGEVVGGLKVRRGGFIAKYTEIGNLKVAYEGLRSELMDLVPCIDQHLKYGGGRDSWGMYLYVSSQFMSFMLRESTSIPCGNATLQPLKVSDHPPLFSLLPMLHGELHGGPPRTTFCFYCEFAAASPRGGQTVK